MTDPASHKVCRASWYLGYYYRKHWFRIPGCHCLWLIFPDHSSIITSSDIVVPQPQSRSPSLDFSGFARRYSRNLVWFIFLWVLRCFSSPGSRITHKAWNIPTFIGTGYPIRKPSISNVCWRTHRCYRARTRVLLRLKLPRHPPLAWFLPSLSLVKL